MERTSAELFRTRRNFGSGNETSQDVDEISCIGTVAGRNPASTTWDV